MFGESARSLRGWTYARIGRGLLEGAGVLQDTCCMLAKAGICSLNDCSLLPFGLLSTEDGEVVAAAV